jgi:hypothetical protein
MSTAAPHAALCIGVNDYRTFDQSIGQAAGTAAVFAIRAGTAVQDVPYATLRERLLADGAKLSGDDAPKRQPQAATGTPRPVTAAPSPAPAPSPAAPAAVAP